MADDHLMPPEAFKVMLEPEFEVRRDGDGWPDARRRVLATQSYVVLLDVATLLLNGLTGASGSIAAMPANMSVSPAK